MTVSRSQMELNLAAAQPVDQTLVAGLRFVGTPSVQRFGVVRLHSDLTSDASFGSGGFAIDFEGHLVVGVGYAGTAGIGTLLVRLRL